MNNSSEQFDTFLRYSGSKRYQNTGSKLDRAEDPAMGIEPESSLAASTVTELNGAVDSDSNDQAYIHHNFKPPKTLNPNKTLITFKWPQK